jgi:putative proteasome-type protease
MSTWSEPGERIISIMTAGNLATTQAVISQIEERTKAPGDRRPSILEAPTMFQIATIVGRLLCDVIEGRQDAGMQSEGPRFTASMIVAGQIKDMEPRLFLIYPEGNFIEAGVETTYLQTGETKYGKPIIDRVIRRTSSLNEAVKCALVSMDSTIRSNLSVGLPLDLVIVKRDQLRVARHMSIDSSNEYFRQISSGWSDALRQAFVQLPDNDWAKMETVSPS